MSGRLDHNKITRGKRDEAEINRVNNRTARGRYPGQPVQDKRTCVVQGETRRLYHEQVKKSSNVKVYDKEGNLIRIESKYKKAKKKRGK